MFHSENRSNNLEKENLSQISSSQPLRGSDKVIVAVSLVQVYLIVFILGLNPLMAFSLSQCFKVVVIMVNW